LFSVGAVGEAESQNMQMMARWLSDTYMDYLIEYGAGTNEDWSDTSSGMYVYNYKWRLVGFSFDPTNKELRTYQNGIAGVRTYTNSPSGGGDSDLVLFGLANYSPADYCFKGWIANAMLWDRVLDEREVGRLLASGYNANPGYGGDRHTGVSYRLMERTPKSLWKLHDPGNAHDSLLNNDGSANSGVTTQVYPGIVVDRDYAPADGAHASFDGSGDYLRLGPVGGRGTRTQRHTYSCFFIADNMTNTGTLFSVSASGESLATNYRNSYRRMISSGNPYYQNFNESGSGVNETVNSGSTRHRAGETIHFACACGYTTRRIWFYENGRRISTATYSNSASGGTSGYTQIGTRYDGNSSPFAGDMEQVAFYRVPLSAKAIMSIFTQGLCYHDIQAAQHFNLPASYWNLRETSGTRHDWRTATTTPSNLTAGGAPTHSTSGPVSAMQSHSFDGTDDYFYAADSAQISITGEMWISAWINKSAAPTTKNEGIISKRAASQHAYALEMTTNGYIELYISPAADATGAVTLTDDTDLTDGQWHLVIAYFKPSTVMEIWVDGILHARSTSSIPASIADTTAQLLIGCTVDTADADYMFGGFISDPAVYDLAQADTDASDINDYETTWEKGDPADDQFIYQTPLEMWQIWAMRYFPTHKYFEHQRQQEPVFLLPMQEYDPLDTTGFALVYCEPGAVTDGSASYYWNAGSDSSQVRKAGPADILSVYFGGSDYLEADAYATDLDAHAQGTIELIFKTSADGTLFELLGATPADDAVQVKVEATTGYLQWYVESGGTVSVDAEVQTDYADGAWHHVVIAVTTGTGTKIYIDGAEATITWTTGSASSVNFLDDITGADVRVGSGLAGYITGLAVYDTPLTEAQANKHWLMIRESI